MLHFRLSIFIIFLDIVWFCFVSLIYELAVQINSKIKAKIVVPSNASQQEIQDIALSDSQVKAALGEQQVLKVIVIPKRLVNIVAK